MFKIEPAEWRDTFRIRCNKNPHELYEVSAITTDGLDNINSFRTTLGEALSQHDYTAADKLADLLKIVTDTRAAQRRISETGSPPIWKNRNCLSGNWTRWFWN